MNFKEEMQQKTAQVEAILQKFLPEAEGLQKTVLEAMNYSMLAGGKRLRPMMMQEAYRMFGGEGPEIEPFMAAIEMVHTYSLVHDDLPAMDNDEYRRGRKTTHAVYGEAMAILAGDALLNYAFETALKAFDRTTHQDRVIRALQVLAQKAGIFGMIGGQTADMEAEAGQKDVTEETLLFIHANKTAALIQAALMCGAILAGAPQADTDRMEKAAYNIGIAFQIQDDILDVTSTDEVLGKPTGSDAKNGKMTYVSLKGIEQARADDKALSEEAARLLAGASGRNLFLEELVRQLMTREK